MINWVTVIICCVLVFVFLVCSGYIVSKQLRSNAKILALLYMFVVIWIARFWVNYFTVTDEMSTFEKCIDSFVHALQTFSMDEDYTSYTLTGKELIRGFGMPVMSEIYGMVISILNVCAPIMGGAVLLDVLTGFFPQLRLLMHPRKRKFVFSELNEMALTLAEDLCSGDNYRNIVLSEFANAERCLEKIFGFSRPMIIFTDTYADNESEEKSELIDKAKALHAVCVKNDLQFLFFSHSKAVYYFFVDEREETSISGLSDVLNKQKEIGRMFPCGKDAEDIRTRMFVFCQSDLSVMLADSIAEKAAADMPIIVRSISDYTNAAVNLMYEMPLFIPLLDCERSVSPVIAENHTLFHIGNFITEKDERGRLGGVIPTRELHVAVVGGGALAEAVLKAVYWCGQIAGVQLYVHIITNNVGKFRNRIMSGCPELLESCQKNSDLLRCYNDKECSLYNPPYAVIDGMDVDIDAEPLFASPDSIMKKTDYFIIALEDESKNITISVKLKQWLSRRGLAGHQKSHAVIAPAVYDQRFADSIAAMNPGKYEPYIVPFALLNDRFSCKSVFMSDATADAWQTEMLYNKQNHEKRKKDEYSYWANINRAIHAPYKLFAFGQIKSVDLSSGSQVRYSGGGDEIQPDDRVFSWMEHRRWNACMRAQGFTMPSDKVHEAYFAESGLHKDLTRKYHNCLVESSVNGEKIPVNAGGDTFLLDALDMESLKAYRMNCKSKGEAETAEGFQDAEYKQWDNYVNDAAAKTLMERLKQNGGRR